MKKQTKLNLRTSLQSIGLFFLIFFAMAFACQDDPPRPSPPNNNGQTPIVRNGTGCSSEAEFRRIFERDRLKTTATRNDLQPPEIRVTSFNVAASITDSAVYNNKVVNISPAYPVIINWTQRTFRFGKIEEGDFEGGLFYCYKNPEDNNKFTPEDDRFPQNACVCIAQNPQAITATRWRDCPYDENEPTKTCSAN